MINFYPKIYGLHFCLVLSEDYLHHEQYLCKHLLGYSFQYPKMLNQEFSFQVFLKSLLVLLFLGKEFDILNFLRLSLSFLKFKHLNSLKKE